MGKHVRLPLPPPPPPKKNANVSNSGRCNFWEHMYPSPNNGIEESTSIN